MEQSKRKLTFAQVLTALIYLASGQRIAIGPARKAVRLHNEREWAEKVIRNQKALDAKHEAGRSVRSIDGKSQFFKPFSSNPDFKASTDRV